MSHVFGAVVIIVFVDVVDVDVDVVAVVVAAAVVVVTVVFCVLDFFWRSCCLLSVLFFSSYSQSYWLKALVCFYSCLRHWFVSVAVVVVAAAVVAAVVAVVAVVGAVLCLLLLLLLLFHFRQCISVYLPIRCYIST